MTRNVVVGLVIAAGVVAWGYILYRVVLAPAEDQAVSAPVDENAGDGAVGGDPVATFSKYGPESTDKLREHLSEEHPPEVRAAAAQRLGRLRDFESAEKLLDLMDDPSPQVRGRAGVALQRILGADYGFHAHDPPEKRRKIIAALRKVVEAWKNQPPPVYDESDKDRGDS